jgi:glycosyltransferase involved in cell wall biosynthesis
MDNSRFDILFFASYPFFKINEGMSQRILQIDEKFANKRRVYIHCSVFWLKGSITKWVSDDIMYVKLNPLLHYKLLKSLLKRSAVLYFHSVYNYTHCCFISLKNHSVVLDIHGVVPEENFMAGRKLRGVIYGWMEKRLVNYVKLAICVSEKMKAHFQQKYPLATTKYLILPIIQEPAGSNKLPEVKELMHDDVVFIYSGGLQKWQNIPLMLETVQKLKSRSYLFLFLTQQPEALNEMLAQYNMNGHRIIVRSASKEELPGYYSISHYGFLLRDEHIVNEVACPTKMYEYLEAGITPVLLSRKIGDYEKMNIDVLSLSDIDDSLIPKKSINNQQQVARVRDKVSIDLWPIVSSL